MPFCSTGPVAAGLSAACAFAIAAKSGSCGAGAAFEPGFQPFGISRGAQSV